MLLWQILILGEAFEQEGSGGAGAGRGGGETLQYVRGNYTSLKGTNKSDGCSKKTSLYITCLVLFTEYYSSRFDVIIQCIASSFVVVHGSQDRIFQSMGTTM